MFMIALLVLNIRPRGFIVFLAFQIRDAMFIETAWVTLGSPAFHNSTSEGTLSPSLVFVIVLAADLIVLFMSSTRPD